MARDTTASLFDKNDTPIQNDQPSAQVEIYKEISKEIFNDSALEQKTDLNTRQVLAMARAATFAEQYDRKMLKVLINKLSLYSISHNRKGRKEYVDISKSVLGMAHQEDEAHSIPDRLLGRT